MNNLSTIEKKVSHPIFLAILLTIDALLAVTFGLEALGVMVWSVGGNNHPKWTLFWVKIRFVV